MDPRHVGSGQGESEGEGGVGPGVNWGGTVTPDQIQRSWSGGGGQGCTQIQAKTPRCSVALWLHCLLKALPF